MKGIDTGNFSVARGVVSFSESRFTPGRFNNLELGLDGSDDRFWIRGEHRIDCGEKVKLYHNDRQRGNLPIVVRAYELLHDSGEVKYRRFCNG